MIGGFFNTVFYAPLYNAMVLAVALAPRHDLGIAVVALTIAVKAALAPLAHSSMKTQQKLRGVEGKVNAIKEKHKDKQEQAEKIMNLYKEHGINPLSGLVVAIVQIPIILGLYFVFRAGFDAASPLVYAFTPRPALVNNLFLGLFDVTKPSIILSALAAVSQFFQLQLSVPPSPKAKSGAPQSFQEEFSKSLNFQTRYLLPLFIFFISLKFTAALPLYWTASSLFSVGHELYVRRMARAVVAEESVPANNH